MKLEYINNFFIRIKECNDANELDIIKRELKRRIINWRFHPLVKRGFWDGNIKFIDKFNNVPIGLWYELYEITKKYNFDYQFPEIKNIIDENITYDDVKNFAYDFFKDHPLYGKGKPKELRDYQIDAVYKILKFRYSSSEIATSAGKTMIIFLVFAYLYTHNKLNTFLIVVPSTSLILQTIENFNEYNNFKLKFNIQAIYAATEKERTNAECIIGTYQSLVKRPASWFNGINVVCIDEAHHTNSSSIKTIISKCRDSEYRFGLSGTLKINEQSAEYLTIQSYLGPIVNNISPKFLMDNKYVSTVRIAIYNLNYLDDELKKKLYMIRHRRLLETTKILDLERKIVIENEVRMRFIIKLIKNIKNNALLLFNDIKNGYGKKIYHRLREETNKIVFYIDGSTPTKERISIFHQMNEGENKVLVASFGTLGQGVSINNIYYVFFLESFKSPKIIKQAIGRGMRLKSGVNKVLIIDIADNFSYNNNNNYLYRHALARIELYKKENFDFKIFNVDINKINKLI